MLIICLQSGSLKERGIKRGVYKKKSEKRSKNKPKGKIQLIKEIKGITLKELCCPLTVGARDRIKADQINRLATKYYTGRWC